MLEVWFPAAIVAAAVAAAGLYFVTRRPRAAVFADPREERLTRKLAITVGCSLEQALPAVRREIEIAPNQTEETLIKRAAYHYRQELSEAACRVYRDTVRG